MKTLKRIGILALCAAMLSGQFGQPTGVFNKSITITSGTPIRITTSHIVVDSLLIQAAHSATFGIVYICAFATTPASKCSGTGQLGGELAPASATAPGSAYSYPMPTPGLDLSLFWVDGDANSPVIVSYHVK